MNAKLQSRPDLLLLLSLFVAILLAPVLNQDNWRRLVLAAVTFIPIILSIVRLSQIKRWLWPSVLLMLAAGFPHVYLFRPAYIFPVEPRKEPNFNYRLMRAIYPVFRVLFPNQVIRADDLARAMVDVVLRQTHERQAVVFENRDIRAMTESRTPPTNRAV